MTDYEKEYQKNESACGEPFAEIENFFSGAAEMHYTVLDLGCGQGRDSLMAAGYGHTVLGVDLSPTGIRQMKEKAATQGLKVDGTVADIRTFKPPGKFEVVILDRVVHMFVTPEDQIRLLKNAADSTIDGGHILLADTPKTLPVIDDFFGSSSEWKTIFQKMGFRFYQRLQIK